GSGVLREQDSLIAVEEMLKIVLGQPLAHLRQGLQGGTELARRGLDLTLRFQGITRKVASLKQDVPQTHTPAFFLRRPSLPGGVSSPARGKVRPGQGQVGGGGDWIEAGGSGLADHPFEIANRLGGLGRPQARKEDQPLIARRLGPGNRLPGYLQGTAALPALEERCRLLGKSLRQQWGIVHLSGQAQPGLERPV